MTSARCRARVCAWAGVAALVASALTASCRRPTEVLRASEDKFTVGNAQNGAKLILHFECVRCHDGAALEEPQARFEKACVGCHEAIVDGTFAASPASLAKWNPLVKDLRFAPTLADLGRLRSSWLVSFLQRPHDLRPGLTMTMPRLAIGEAEAKDIAARLMTTSPPRPATSSALGKPDLMKGNAERGQQLLASKGCVVCHRLTGGPPIVTTALSLPFAMPPKFELERAMALAPDLRYARDRYEPAMLAAWIRKPSDLKPASDMPDIAMTDEEARDVATFLLTTPLANAPKPALQKLPLLTRPVAFDEVNAKVFHRTCWHCHSEPDFAIGDGGPGNSGGFGFAPRGVDLSSFQGVMAGFLERPLSPAPVGSSAAPASAPRRKSLFAPVSAADPTSRLVASLVARHTEESGSGVSTGEVRGMPLGLPPLSLEDIQLVETWISQGRPR